MIEFTDFERALLDEIAVLIQAVDRVAEALEDLDESPDHTAPADKVVKAIDRMGQNICAMLEE